MKQEGAYLIPTRVCLGTCNIADPGVLLEYMSDRRGSKITLIGNLTLYLYVGATRRLTNNIKLIHKKITRLEIW